MIYQDIKRFLKGYLNQPSQRYEWGENDNALLLDFVHERYNDEYIELNLSEIRQAFRDFFEPIGSIVVRYKLNNGISYKIIPYYVQEKNSKHLTKIVEIIHKNKKHIEYPHKGRVDQIALLGKIRRHINAELVESDEAVNKKELIRYAIKKALKLDERDVVVTLRKKYIVKIFKCNSFINTCDEEPKAQDTQERRFQGYAAEELVEHYNELINDIDLEAFLDDVMTYLFATDLNFNEITNSYYEKHVLSLIRSQIAKELEQYVSYNKEYLLGFAGYIFRENFEKIHERIAIEIFEKIAVNNANAKKFLQYYSGTVLIEHGKRYILPELSAPNGRRWNATSLSATATMWLRTRHKEKVLHVRTDNLESEYLEVEAQYKTILANRMKYKNTMDTYEKQQLECQERINHLRKKFKFKNDGELSEIETIALGKLLSADQQIILTIKEKILKIKPLQENTKKEFREIKLKYQDLKATKQQIQNDIMELQKNLNLNSDAFYSVLGSLVKSLLQRKKLIVEE